MEVRHARLEISRVKTGEDFEDIRFQASAGDYARVGYTDLRQSNAWPTPFINQDEKLSTDNLKVVVYFALILGSN